jgi:hypothetical protein
MLDKLERFMPRPLKGFSGGVMVGVAATVAAYGLSAKARELVGSWGGKLATLVHGATPAAVKH